MGDESAGCAFESRLIRTIGTGNMPTARTFLRRIARVNYPHRNAFQGRFVGDLESQAVEVPAMQLVASPALNRYPLADVRQVFQRNAASSVFRLFNQLLTDAVV